MTNAAKTEERVLDLTADMRKYTHQIWLAGLGAYAKAGKDGAEYFRSLVSEGEELEERGRELFSDRFEGVTSRVEELKEKWQTRTGTRFNKVEEVFDDRVASALTRMGIPSKKDIDALSAKLDNLSVALNTLQSK
ncbi:phasin family protein [Halopseudomonas nanhaiensis]|uniref:phasin family protein n=1 Tax=Halopseudomonas nanhaiensis TaxID=2830842 RepID=UPI001CBCB170|nr:phasin family protein [Halopseudomonas nanhaiensis]UAW98183.1 phasin family protein [Halopseudomonas nanhaiensis]